MKLLKLIPVLALLVVLFAVPVTAAEADTSAQGEGSVSDAETSEPVVEPVPEGPTEIEYLASINTYLTYLFCFGAVIICVVLFVLVYKFFNMFF